MALTRCRNQVLIEARRGAETGLKAVMLKGFRVLKLHHVERRLIAQRFVFGVVEKYFYQSFAIKTSMPVQLPAAVLRARLT